MRSFPPPTDRARATASVRTQHEIALDSPFRLDLTVSALRRLPTNIIDVLTPTAQYLLAFEGAQGPLIARVAQPRARSLAVTIEGNAVDASDRKRGLALIRRTLGVDRDVRPFTRAAATVPWLAPLARRMRGIKPPRYRSLWEAFVNAVVFQQVSLHAASAVVQRLILAFGIALESEGTPLYLFPNAHRVLHGSDRELRGLGLSASKIATLRRAGDAVASGAIDEPMLEQRASADAASLLQQIKGIGPWTATVILLRGFGRLDVFPMKDSGVARSLGLVARTALGDVGAVLDTLGSQRGMLYYHLLLARLDAQGTLAQPSVAPPCVTRTHGGEGRA